MMSWNSSRACLRAFGSEDVSKAALPVSMIDLTSACRESWASVLMLTVTIKPIKVHCSELFLDISSW